MNEGIIHRTKLLLGNEAMSKILKTKVIIFGLGGVGSWCAESLVRSGIEELTIVDFDKVCITNINRQIQATSSNIGQVKVHELKKRFLEINPDAKITTSEKIYNENNHKTFNLDHYDYIIDAIDSLNNKIHLIETALKTNATLFSSMGAALKIDPTKIKIDDIWKTSGCPLAREIRKALRKKNIHKKFKCVFSEEVLSQKRGESYDKNEEKIVNGSIVHITAIFGFMLSSLVIQSILSMNDSSPL